MDDEIGYRFYGHQTDLWMDRLIFTHGNLLRMHLFEKTLAFFMFKPNNDPDDPRDVTPFTAKLSRGGNRARTVTLFLGLIEITPFDSTQGDGNLIEHLGFARYGYSICHFFFQIGYSSASNFVAYLPR